MRYRDETKNFLLANCTRITLKFLFNWSDRVRRHETWRKEIAICSEVILSLGASLRIQNEHVRNTYYRSLQVSFQRSAPTILERSLTSDTRSLLVGPKATRYNQRECIYTHNFNPFVRKNFVLTRSAFAQKLIRYRFFFCFRLK